MSLFCPAAAGGALRLLRPPPASWTGLASLGNTVGMLGHVFDHQVPLTRPLEAVGAACSSSRSRFFIDFVFHWLSLICIDLHCFSLISIGFLQYLHTMVIEQAVPTVSRDRARGA